jgi:uncharacterized protein YfcZ (UPF0381/DUF406 family)
MKPKSFALTLCGCAVLAAAVLLPRESAGQALTDAEAAQVQQVLAELTAQQKIIAENQAKIDEKVAAVAEEVRVARIFAGRAGGKK